MQYIQKLQIILKEYDSISNLCFSTGNVCPSSEYHDCSHSEDVTVECCELEIHS